MAHAQALLKATPNEQRTDVAPPGARENKTAPLEQIVKLEKEISQVHTQYKDAEQNYSYNLFEPGGGQRLPQQAAGQRSGG